MCSNLQDNKHVPSTHYKIVPSLFPCRKIRTPKTKAQNTVSYKVDVAKSASNQRLNERSFECFNQDAISKGDVTAHKKSQPKTKKRKRWLLYSCTVPAIRKNKLQEFSKKTVMIFLERDSKGDYSAHTLIDQYSAQEGASGLITLRLGILGDCCVDFLAWHPRRLLFVPIAEEGILAASFAVVVAYILVKGLGMIENVRRPKRKCSCCARVGVDRECDKTEEQLADREREVPLNRRTKGGKVVRGRVAVGRTVNAQSVTSEIGGEVNGEMFKLFKEEVDCHTRQLFDSIDVITEVYVTKEEMSTEIVKEALDGHHNAKVKENLQRRSMVDIVVENEALLSIIVDQEDSIAKLEKVVEKLEMFLAQKRQQKVYDMFTPFKKSKSKKDEDIYQLMIVRVRLQRKG
ncbi:hypothetical protein V8G54_003647 [Vigna mungo]|uniref:Uncharacterized protein n=1 Tax=Vigna mungo TaxID=3915 RepID=A0AAQ3PEA9_VIGMU